MTITLTVSSGLKSLCDSLNDTEDLRKAVNNRLNAMTRVGEDADGKVRGLGLPDSDPDVINTRTLAEKLTEAEVFMIKNVEKIIKGSPYAEYVKSNLGMGFKTIGRLLGALGDPYIAVVRNEETGMDEMYVRSVRQLWAYSGYAVDNGKARSRRKGMEQKDIFALGNQEVKMRAYILAESAMKTGKNKDGERARLRRIYDSERDKQLNAVHSGECVRCGTSGKPAQPGSPLKDGHKHMRAIRKVSKEILKDLYNIAKTWHEFHGIVAAQEEFVKT